MQDMKAHKPRIEAEKCEPITRLATSEITAPQFAYRQALADDVRAGHPGIQSGIGIWNLTIT